MFFLTLYSTLIKNKSPYNIPAHNVLLKFLLVQFSDIETLNFSVSLYERIILKWKIFAFSANSTF